MLHPLDRGLYGVVDLLQAGADAFAGVMQKVVQALYLREARFGKGRGVGSKFLICGRVSSMIWFAAVNTVPALANGLHVAHEILGTAIEFKSPLQPE